MDGSVQAQRLGWMSVAVGLTELTFPERICQLLGVRGRSGLVRALGLREVLVGLGLLTRQDARPWLWGRVLGDVVDLVLLGATFRRPARTSAWRIATTLTVAGATVTDFLAARQWTAKRSTTPGDWMDVSHAPAESWRGSALAEELGASPHEEESAVDEAKRQRRMKDAERQLGLPDPDARGMHRRH